MVQTTQAAGTASKTRLSLSTQIAIGVALGAATGLFFGERVSGLQIIADAYVKLLQMTVLPYVTISIVSGLGGLNAAQARTLGVRVGIVLALLWTVALAAVLLFPLMFPPSAVSVIATPRLFMPTGSIHSIPPSSAL